MTRIANILCPPRLVPARRRFGSKPIRILDIGCGNHSPSITKRWMPNAEYHGADIQKLNLDSQDELAMDFFHPLTVDGGGYSSIPDRAFDFVILNHVLEHIRTQDDVVREACRKLRAGGLIWIAFPSIRSLNLPSAEGTLNFCDDSTHLRVCSVREVANCLIESGVRVLKGGRTWAPMHYLIGLLVLPWAFGLKVMTGKLKSKGLWYVMGFEDRVLGQKSA